MDATVDDPHVDRPEEEEAGELRAADAKFRNDRSFCQRRNEHREDLVNRLAADPRLDAEPTAGDERAEHGGNVRSAHAEGRAAIHGERDAVFRASVGVEHHRDEHDDVAEKDCENGLRPVHALADQRRGEHVGRDARRHRDPERGEVPAAPFAAGGRHGGEVGVPERAGGEVLRGALHLRIHSEASAGKGVGVDAD